MKLSQQEKEYIAKRPKWSASQLSRKLGRAPSIITRHRRRLGQYYISPWNEEKDRILIEMVNSGKTHKQMARRLRKTVDAVYSRLKKLRASTNLITRKKKNAALEGQRDDKPIKNVPRWAVIHTNGQFLKARLYFGAWCALVPQAQNPKPRQKEVSQTDGLE